MPFGTITSTSNTFGSISGDVGANVPGTLTGSVGVPGPQGPQGPQGIQGPPGPAGPGSTWGGIAGTLSAQTDLWTELGTKLNSSTAASTYQTQSAMSAYLTKADNLASVASVSAARDNLGLGSLSTPTFAGVTVQGSGANVANLTPTSLSLTHASSGSFTIQPSVGITFPNGSVQTTAFTGVPADYITSVSSPLSVSAGNLTIDLSAYLTTAAAASTYYLQTNPAGYQTAAQVSTALTGYATQSFVAANYAPIAAGLPTGGTVGQVLTKNSGTDYDDSWQTLIPGDRYLTTSSTSNTIGNGSKTFTVGTGLSYSSQQDVVISFNASNHMHALVTSYNSGTGVLVVDVQNHTGSGTYTAWTINVGGTTPLQSVEWGEILGTLGDQSDLASALNGKLESTTAASTYAALAGATFTGEVVTPASTTSNAGLTITPGVAPSTPTNGEIWATTTDLQVRLNGVTETLAEQSWVTAGFYPLTGNPSGFLTSSALTPYALLSGATFTGLVTTPAATTTTAGLNVPHGAAPTTPVNGDVWTTTGGLFWRQNAATKQAMNLGDTQTVSGNITFSNGTLTLGSSTGASTYNLGSGATTTGITKAINIGTAGASGSTTNITVGPVAGTSTTNIGNTTAASTLNLATGATLTATTKAVNLGTSGVAGSTTNITIGSTTGTSTTTLQGTTNGVTAAADTNSVALATTAYVVGQAGSATPLVDGTAAVGTSLRYARQDHVHPTDTSRAPLASPAFTGTPSLPTGTTAVTQTAGNNTTAVATTAFVTAAVPAFATFTTPTPTSTTTVVNPKVAMDYIMHPGRVDLYGAASTATSGAGTYVAINGRWKEMVGPTAGVAGYAMIISDLSYLGLGLLAMNRGTSFMGKIWNKGIWVSGRGQLGGLVDSTQNGDANGTVRVSLGGKSSASSGDISTVEPGIGWKSSPGSAMQLVVSKGDGSAITTVTSSFTPTIRASFDWKIYSDGAGNVTLYINDSQVATTANGPSTGTAEDYNFYFEMVEQTSSAAARLAWESVNSRAWVGV